MTDTRIRYRYLLAAIAVGLSASTSEAYADTQKDSPPDIEGVRAQLKTLESALEDQKAIFDKFLVETRQLLNLRSPEYRTCSTRIALNGPDRKVTLENFKFDPNGGNGYSVMLRKDSGNGPGAAQSEDTDKTAASTDGKTADSKQEEKAETASANSTRQQQPSNQADAAKPSGKLLGNKPGGSNEGDARTESETSGPATDRIRVRNPEEPDKTKDDPAKIAGNDLQDTSGEEKKEKGSQSTLYTPESLRETFFAPKYQSVGALLYRKNVEEPLAQSCSGALVSPSFFLTAAHCVHKDLASSGYRVFLPYGGIRQVVSVHIRPDAYEHGATRFNAPSADIALLKLSEPFAGIKLPKRLVHDETLPVGLPARILGYGVTGAENDDSGILRSGQVCIQQCLGSVNEKNGIVRGELRREDFVCWQHSASGEKRELLSNTCSGDSGGPTFIDVFETETETGNGKTENKTADVILAGVTSGGVQADCDAGDHAFNTAVSAHEVWIDETVGIDVPANPLLLQTPPHPIHGRFDEDSEQFAYVLDGTEFPSANVLRLTFNTMKSEGAKFRFHILSGNRRDIGGRYVKWRSAEKEFFSSWEMEMSKFKNSFCAKTSDGEYVSPCLFTVVAERRAGKGEFQILASWWKRSDR